MIGITRWGRRASPDNLRDSISSLEPVAIAAVCRRQTHSGSPAVPAAALSPHISRRSTSGFRLRAFLLHNRLGTPASGQPGPQDAEQEFPDQLPQRT